MATAGKLGKLAPKYNKRTLRLSNYLKGPLPTAPAKLWREYKVPPSGWNMLGNDTVGDCTCAAIAHMVMLFTAHTGTMISPTLEDTLGVYSAVTGYNPADPSTDQGANITDVLAYWQSTGIAGHKILGWASIGLSPAQIQQAMYLFGAVDIGFNVPAYAMEQFNAGQAWDIDPSGDATIEGGHSVPLFGYGSQGFDCTTWGANQKLTTTFAATFCDEAYIVLTEDWLDSATGLAPNQIDLATLQADLNAVKA